MDLGPEHRVSVLLMIVLPIVLMTPYHISQANRLLVLDEKLVKLRQVSILIVYNVQVLITEPYRRKYPLFKVYLRQRIRINTNLIRCMLLHRLQIALFQDPSRRVRLKQDLIFIQTSRLVINCLFFAVNILFG